MENEVFRGIDSWQEHMAWVKFSYDLTQKIDSVYITDFEKIEILNLVHTQLEKCDMAYYEIVLLVELFLEKLKEYHDRNVIYLTITYLNYLPDSGNTFQEQKDQLELIKSSSDFERFCNQCTNKITS